MSYHPELQPRDFDILRPLVYSYRVTTAAAEAHRYGIARATAARRLNQLVRGRLLNRLWAWCSEIPPIRAPLARWQPGEPEPDFGAVAYAAQQRFTDRPVRRISIYTASNKLLAMYGLPPRPHLKLHQATHDLGVLEAYFYCRSRWPHYEFRGEDCFSHERGHGEGVEDAQLLDGEEVVAVVEYAGTYRRHRVRHFHEHVAERQVPYLLF